VVVSVCIKVGGGGFVGESVGGDVWVVTVSIRVVVSIVMFATKEVGCPEVDKVDCCDVDKVD